MKNLDFRSVIIGILSSALIFTLYGMRFQDENLGDITVKSITIEPKGWQAPFVIKNKKGNPSIVIASDENDSGWISLFTNDGTEIVNISSNANIGGRISTYTSSGIMQVSISGTVSGDGDITIYNRHDKEVIVMQGDKDADGLIILNDRYGDAGWYKTGKQ